MTGMLHLCQLIEFKPVPNELLQEDQMLQVILYLFGFSLLSLIEEYEKRIPDLNNDFGDLNSAGNLSSLSSSKSSGNSHISDTQNSYQAVIRVILINSLCCVYKK